MSRPLPLPTPEALAATARVDELMRPTPGGRTWAPLAEDLRLTFDDRKSASKPFCGVSAVPPDETPYVDLRAAEEAAGGVPGCGCGDCIRIRTEIRTNLVQKLSTEWQPAEVTLGKSQLALTPLPFWNQRGRGLPRVHPIWWDIRRGVV